MKIYYPWWLVMIAMVVSLTGCAFLQSVTEPTINEDAKTSLPASDTDDPFFEVRAAVIDAKVFILSAYKAIPVNKASGLWTDEFAREVYDGAEDLERVVAGVETAINLGNLNDAETQALLLSKMLVELRKKVDKNGGLNGWYNGGRTVAVHRSWCGPGIYGREGIAHQAQCSSDGGRRSELDHGQQLARQSDCFSQECGEAVGGPGGGKPGGGWWGRTEPA